MDNKNMDNKNTNIDYSILNYAINKEVIVYFRKNPKKWTEEGVLKEIKGNYILIIDAKRKNHIIPLNNIAEIDYK